VSDIRRAERELGWHPTVGIDEGLRRLWQWVNENADLFVGRSPALAG
jgi:nucleoside-diphosphate-sugar epimerase